MNSEERILEMLEKLTETVGKQGEHLEKLTETVDKQGKHLEKLTGMAERQGEHLEKLTRMAERQGERLDEIDSRSLRSAVILENEVLPKLQLLYEGQVHLQETLAPKDQVEILEDEVITLKSTVKIMMKRLDALEKAQ